jgi:hypothetical protein
MNCGRGMRTLDESETAGLKAKNMKAFDPYLYFPSHRIEVGTSYGRMFEGAHEDASGVHFWWQPWSIPLSIRSEYGHGTHAQGYWMEAAYRGKTPASHAVPEDQAERKFRQNCSRCHNAPEELPTRVTGTVLLHMRVRASLSAADERAILRYLAP